MRRPPLFFHGAVSYNSRMKKSLIAKRSLAFLCVFAVTVAFILFPRAERAQAATCAVRIWNVDTFEGGKGSRTSFLNRIAASVRKKHREVYFLVRSYTVEGARSAFLSGDRPDLISYGVGLGEGVEYFLPIDRSELAVAWYRGRYYRFSLTDDFGEEGRTAISVGGSNVPLVAALLAGIEGEEVPSQEAYVKFLGGGYRYLLGTQRDVCRFAARGVTVYRQPLDAYCDLYGYISLLSSEKRQACEWFLQALLSEEAQSNLSSVGLYPVGGLDPPQYTLEPFSGADALDRLRNACLGGSDGKNIVKFLKKV